MRRRSRKAQKFVAPSLFILFGLLLFLLSFSTFARNAVASFTWETAGLTNITLALTRNANFAKQIGDYYFNGPSFAASFAQGYGRPEEASNFAKASMDKSAGEGHTYNPKLAEKAYQRALAINPKIPYGNYQLARVYFVQKKYDQAIEVINRELKVNSESFRSYYIRGLIYGYRGNLDKAETDFREFIKWTPREWAGYNDLAWILNMRAKYQDAEEVVKIALIQAPSGAENPWLWNSLGVAELNLGKYGAAEQSFLKAQKFAETLTLADWRAAYPGNDAATAEGGLAAFREAIERNLETARIMGQ